MRNGKPTKDSDPLFWGNLFLLLGAFLSVPLSYFFQPPLVRQSEALPRYTGQTFVALPNLFDQWPGGQGLKLTAGKDQAIVIENADPGVPTAADLGITLTAAPGQTVPGFELRPRAAGVCRLSDLTGGSGSGVRLGSVKVLVDGKEVIADLWGCKTLGEVVDRINGAIATIDAAAAGVRFNGYGLNVWAAAGHKIRVENADSTTVGAPLDPDPMAATRPAETAQTTATQPAAAAATQPTGAGILLTPGTLLAALPGATGQGIHPQQLKLKVDKSDADVDLTKARTVGEVLKALNDNIQRLNKQGGEVVIQGRGLVVLARANHVLTIEETDKKNTTAKELGLVVTGNGTVGADLGLILTAEGRTEPGRDLGAKAADYTPLTALTGATGRGVGAGSVKVTVNGQSTVVDLRGAATLGEVVTWINGAIPGADGKTAGLAVAVGDSLSAAGEGFVVRLMLGLFAGGGLALGLFLALRRNRQRKLGLSPDAPLGSPETLKVGTLTYTKAALAGVFLWILWGDFCFQLMELLFPILMPLQLKGLGANNTTIGFLVRVLPNILGFALTPIISFKSDRYRSKWGRRIPFIVLTAPFLCVFLGLLGYAKPIGDWAQSSNLPAHLHLSPLTLALVLVGLLVVGFQFFNNFVNTVFWYLFADVVPPAYMARFVGLFNLVSALAGVAFNAVVLTRAEGHMRQVYWGAALIYFFGFGMMCWRVKEGQYPPVTDVGPRKSRLEAIVDAAKVYVRESFTHPLFLCLFLFNALWALTNACNDVKIFYNRDYIGLSLKQIGLAGSVLGLLKVSLCYIVGWVVDVVHPVRTLLIATVLIIPVTFAGSLVQDYYSYLLVALLSMPINLLWDSSTMPMMIRLLPRERFGQFSSANAMMTQAMRIFAPLVGMAFMDFVSHNGTDLAGYRYVFYWQSGFMLPALGMFLFVYFYWMRHGGAKNYVAPDTSVKV